MFIYPWLKLFTVLLHIGHACTDLTSSLNSVSQRQLVNVSVSNGVNGRVRRNFQANKKRNWKMPIKYFFDSHLKDRRMKRLISKAISFWQDETCVKFQQVEKIRKYEYGLNITDDNGCWSHIGMIGLGGQVVSLSPHCGRLGTVVHELGHVLGFYHEQERKDRSTYITIYPDNIKRKFLSNFRLLSWRFLKTFGYPYDLGSIFQYSIYPFSKNSKPTILTKDPEMSSVIGQRRRASFYDVKTANMAYCKDSCKGRELNCQHRGYTDPNDCSKCKCPNGFGGKVCHHLILSRGHEKCGYYKRISDNFTHKILSPRYPFQYPGHQHCRWLIKGVEHSYFLIKFNLRKFHLRCGRHNNCDDDYFEVRYYSNVALSGPRYCSCLKPTKEIKSFGHTVLMIFHTRFGGKMSFELTYKMMACGGCKTKGGNVIVVHACYKSLITTCTRRWTVKSKRCTEKTTASSDCERQRKRVVECEIPKLYCCEGYTLSDSFCWST